MTSLAASFPTRILDVLTGSLFGDGHLALAPLKGSASLEVTHGEAQLPYLTWKAEQLASLCTHGIKERAMDGSFESQRRFRLRTRYSADLLAFRPMFWREGKRVITQEALGLLSPLALTVWFMDDGSYDRQTESVRFCTHRYSKPDVEVLAAWFATQGICVRLNGCSGRQKGQFMLRSSKATTPQLFALMAPHICAAMPAKYPSSLLTGGAA